MALAQVETAPAAATWWTARRVLVVGLSLVAVQLILRAWVAAAGYFYADDLILTGRSGSYPLISADLLLGEYDGRLVPGAFLVAGVLTRVAPYVWTLPVVSLLLLQALASVGLLVLLRRLAGDRPAVLVPFAVALVSPLTLPAFAWWATGLSALPLQAALAWGCVGALDYVGGRRGRGATLLVGSVAGGLLFSEESLLVPVVGLAVAALVRHVDGRPRPLRGVLRDGAALWSVVFGLAIAWVGLVLWVADGDRLRAPSDLAQAAHLVTASVGGGLVPALVGGPLEWARLGVSTPIAVPPGWLVAAGWAAVAGWVAWALVTRRRTGAVLLAALAYVSLDQVLLVLGHSRPGVPPELGRTLLFGADVVVVVAAAWALVLRAPVRRRLGLPRGLRLGGSIVAVELVVVLSLLSTAAFTRSWAENPTRAYLQRAVPALESAGGTMLDQAVPSWILSEVAYPDNQVSRVFAPVPDAPSIRSATAGLRVLDPAGRLVPGEVFPARSVPPGPRPGCGYWVSGRDEVVIPLDGELFPRVWTLRLGYLADRDSLMWVRLATGAPVRVPVTAGLHDVFVRIEGGGEELGLRTDDPLLRLCLDVGQAGDVIPVVPPAADGPAADGRAEP